MAVPRNDSSHRAGSLPQASPLEVVRVRDTARPRLLERVSGWLGARLGGTPESKTTLHDTYENLLAGGESIGQAVLNRDASSLMSMLAKRRSEHPYVADFKGSYDELAAATLWSATTWRRSVTSVPLLGMEVQERRFDHVLTDHDPEAGTEEAVRYQEGKYLSGVPALLWKLGYAQVESEADAEAGRARFNPAVQWQNDADGGVTASLAFDPRNPLHRMLGEMSGVSNAALQLHVTPEHNSYGTIAMDLHVARADAHMPVAA